MGSFADRWKQHHIKHPVKEPEPDAEELKIDGEKMKFKVSHLDKVQVSSQHVGEDCG